MYAVFATGGKQYRAAPGQVVRVEKLEADEGSTIELDQVLMLSDGEQVTVGAPIIEGAKLAARVVRHGRGDKILVVKFRRRKHHRKQMGHRQSFTDLEITAIQQ